MISQTSEYAVRACLELARRYREGPVRADDIAGELDVPRNYLSKILHALGQERIVRSTRGPGGGFELALEPEDVSLARIVELFEPELLREDGRCILGRGRCSDDVPCPAHARWSEAARGVRAFFRSTTVSDLTPDPLPGKETGRSAGAGA